MPGNTHPESTIFVIFGAAGDLAQRKLIPALYNLFIDGWLPEMFHVFGVGRTEMDSDAFREHLRDGVNRVSRRGKVDAQLWGKFAEHLSYDALDIDTADAYSVLKQKLSELEANWRLQPNRVFYLALPPRMIAPIAGRLAEAGLNQERERDRIVVEKPFGRDFASARELNRLLAGLYQESQIFRIDHIQITVAEQVGVGHRGGYYDHAGALRDMIQNHLMQILCLIAMEAPVSFDFDDVRNKKVDVLHAVRPIPYEQIHRYAARGQYGAGWIQGEHVEGYRSEPQVDPESSTETYAAVKLFVDNWRWQGVPFYLRTGKRLPAGISEVCIQFRPVPHQTFSAAALLDWRPNRLLIAIQPEEGILLRFEVKHPGQTMRLSPVLMQFYYREAFKSAPPEAYETLVGSRPHTRRLGDGPVYGFSQLSGRKLGAGRSGYFDRKGRAQLDFADITAVQRGYGRVPCGAGAKATEAMMHVFNDLEELSQGAAAFLVQQADAAVRSRGRFVLALAGGRTPERTYALLARPPFQSQVNWPRVHIFWGDERCVPLDDPRSNARMAHTLLQDHVPVPPRHVHPMVCRESPREGAQRYEALLRVFFSGNAPCFDLILLGLGANGHTASLFPHTGVLRERKRWVAEMYDADQNLHRITLTARIINQAAAVVFLVAGADKAEVLHAVTAGPQDPMRLPAQLIRPGGGGLHWFVDQAAASRLDPVEKDVYNANASK